MLSVPSCHIARLGHVTFFGQWDVNRYKKPQVQAETISAIPGLKSFLCLSVLCSENSVTQKGAAPAWVLENQKQSRAIADHSLVREE